LKTFFRFFTACLIAVSLFLTNISNHASASEYNSSGFVSITNVDPGIMTEVRYYTNYNFIGDRIDGYEEPLALMTKEAAYALKAVNSELLPKGYCLKIYDAYRPQMAVDHFVRWAKDLNDTRMKPYFYPNVDKSLLFVEGYIASRSGHSRGSTIDLTIFDMKNNCDLDMGGTFDYFGTKSHPYYSNITQQQYNNRMLLRELMLKHGFRGIDTEWWHFTLNNEPYPYTYFKFPINSRIVANN